VEHVCDARRVARFASEQRSDLYFYWFDYTVNAVLPGRSFHGLETNVLFGNDFGPPSSHILTSADLALSRDMRSRWRSFAATGNPNAADHGVRWPLFMPNRFADQSDEHLVLGNTIREARRLRDRECSFWDRLFLRSVVVTVPASAR
jgi:carboxylesterase type B